MYIFIDQNKWNLVEQCSSTNIVRQHKSKKKSLKNYLFQINAVLLKFLKNYFHAFQNNIKHLNSF